MGTGSGAINDLTGLLNCGGNCNCCDDLKQRITQLENKLNEKVSKDELNPAIMMVLGAVLPGAIANGIKPFIGGLQGQITALGLRVTGISTELGRLAGMVFALKAETATATQLARTAMLEVNRLRLEVALAKADAVKALGTSQSAMSKAWQNASALASLVSVVLGIMNTIAILTVIIPRLDGLDKRCDQLSNDISKVYTVIGSIKNDFTNRINAIIRDIGYLRGELGKAFDFLSGEINGLAQRINEAFGQLYNKVDKSELANIQSEISSVRGTANNALAQSIVAIASIAKVSGIANLAISKAETSLSFAKQAQTTAQQADNKANNAQNTATKADSKANNAQKQAEDAYIEAVVAKIISEFSKNKATNAQTTATNAQTTATNAQTTANNVAGKIPPLQSQIDQHSNQITNIYNIVNNYNITNNDQQINNLNGRINNLEGQYNNINNRITYNHKRLTNLE
jgi:predicted PurR-regulated permease PerM